MNKLQQTNKQLSVNEAHEIYENIVALRKSINKNFWTLVSYLKIARDRRIWAVLGHETWASFLAQPEIDLNVRTVDDYIYIFTTISKAIKTSDMSDKMIDFDIDIGKLKIIAPKINEQNADELLVKAKELSRSDLRREMREFNRPTVENVEVEGVINADFRNVKLKENSIDLILTDPPYPLEFIDLWDGLRVFAEKYLKPSGFLVAYSGEINLPEVFKRMEGDLVYYWTYCLYHTGGTKLIRPRNLMNRWKPILIYQKHPYKVTEITYQDYIISEQREKTEHEWQQSESGCQKLIEIFSKEGDLVCDPMAGSGTFPVVAYRMKRKPLAIEIDEYYYKLTKKRLYDETRKNKQQIA